MWDARYTVWHLGQKSSSGGSPQLGCSQLMLWAQSATVCPGASALQLQSSLQTAAIHCTCTLGGAPRTLHCLLSYKSRLQQDRWPEVDVRLLQPTLLRCRPQTSSDHGCASCAGLLLMHLGISALMALASAAAARSGAAVHHLWISPRDKAPLPQVRQLSSALRRTPEARFDEVCRLLCAELLVAEAVANLSSDICVAIPCRTNTEDWAMQCPAPLHIAPHPAPQPCRLGNVALEGAPFLGCKATGSYGPSQEERSQACD